MKKTWAVYAGMVAAVLLTMQAGRVLSSRFGPDWERVTCAKGNLLDACCAALPDESAAAGTLQAQPVPPASNRRAPIETAGAAKRAGNHPAPSGPAANPAFVAGILAEEHAAGAPAAAVPPLPQAHASVPAPADAETEDVLVPSGPAAGRRLRIPDPAEYAGRLPAEQAPAWAAFRQRFPDTDPTDTDALQTALMAERERYPLNLRPEELDAYSAWLTETETLGREMTLARGRFLEIPLNGIDEQGHGYALVGFDGAKPVYTYTQNREAAVSSGASFVRRNAWFDPVFGPGIDGSGYYANVNDHGSIYWHTEFRDDADETWRLTEIRKNDSGSRDHMTHVAGTIGARGAVERAMGMAPAVHMYILIQQYNSDVTGYGMNWPGRPGRSIVGNTSLGSRDDNLSGVYTSTTRGFDLVLYDTPYYQHFYSAGNYGSSYFTLSRGQKAGKNMLTVGAVSDVTRDEDGNRTGGGGITSWSSRGPARDGRIKPDIVANGAGLYSPTTTSGYGSKSGTSMSSPNAAGSAILLQDYFGKLFPGHYIRAATLKTLIIHTAEDLGRPGPDYVYGWGLINVLEGGRHLQDYAVDPACRTLIEDVLSEGQTVAIPYEYTGTGPVRATLGWTDPPGAAQTADTATTPALVNDLNLRLIGPDDAVHLPFVMPYVIGTADKDPFDSSLLGADAVTGTNFTDNVIQVLIAAPVAGEYILEIGHSGSLTGGSQRYSLAVSGLICALPPEPPTIFSHPTVGDNSDFFAFEVTGSGFLLGADLILRRDGSEPVFGYAVETTGSRLFARFDTAAMAKGYWDVVVCNADGRETVSDEPFLLPVPGGGMGTQTLYANTFADGSGLTLEGGWAVGPPNQTAVSGPGSAYAGDNVLGTYLDGEYEHNLHIAAVLPPFSTVNMENIQLSFRRWLGLAYDHRGQSAQGHADYGRIEYSLDGSTWQEVWESSDAFNESSWTLQTHTLPASAEGQPAVHLRFVLETDDEHVSYGWNIDDVKVTGESSVLTLPPVFETEPPKAAVAGNPYEYLAEISDEDTPAAELTFTAETLPTWLTFETTGDGTTATLTGTPQAGDVGDHEVALKATDDAYVTWQIFTVRVYPEGHVPGTPVIGHLAPQNVRWRDATVRANLEEGDAPVHATLHWGTSDGGTDASAWTHEWPLGAKPLGTMLVTLTNLTEETVYYYRFFASNAVGTAWAPAGGEFATLGYRTLTATADAGGGIAPAGIIEVAYGSTQTFAIAASTGHVIDDVLVDGASVGAVEAYTFENVTEDHAIHAEFRSVRVISASAGPGGSIDPSGDVPVLDGADQTFSIVPDEGSFIADVLVDGASVGAVPEYTFVNVTDNHTIEATFSEVQYFVIEAEAGTNGTVEPSGTVMVAEGGSQTFAIGGDPGYRVADVVVDDVSVGAVSEYTFENVTGDHTISASFEPNLAALPYQEHWEAYDIGASPVGRDGWNADSAAFATVEEHDYEYAHPRPLLDPAPVQTNRVLRFDTENSSLSHVFDTEGGYTNIVWDAMAQIVFSPDDEAREAITNNIALQMTFYANTNGYLTLWHQALESPTNRFTVLDAGVAPLASGEWARVTVEFDYRTCPESRKYFRIGLHGQPFFAHAQGLTQPHAALGAPGGSWFLNANQAYTPDFLGAVALSGTGRLDDYTVRPGSAESDKLDQAPIVFEPTTPQTYGTTNALSASGGSGTGGWSFGVVAGAAEIVNGTNLWMKTGTGSVTVRATRAGDADYRPAFLDAEVVAAQAPLAVAADPQSKTVGEADPALTWQFSDGTLFGDDVLAGGLTREAGETSGVYAILRGSLDAGPNYDLTFTGAEFRILTEEGFVDADGNGVDDEWEALHWPEGDVPKTVTKRGIEMTLREVFVAGLDPHDDSVLEIAGMAFAGEDAVRTLTFPAATNRVYAVLATGVLTNGWEVLADDIVPTGTPWQIEFSDPAPPPRFYRLRVRLPDWR